MTMPKKMQIKTIRMLLRKNYHIDPQIIDVESEIDSTLHLDENWRIIKRKYVHFVKGGLK
jgi:hypothetical protein